MDKSTLRLAALVFAAGVVGCGIGYMNYGSALATVIALVGAGLGAFSGWLFRSDYRHRSR